MQQKIFQSSMKSFKNNRWFPSLETCLKYLVKSTNFFSTTVNYPYTYNPDINGNFMITVVDDRNPDIEADYSIVHFSLKHPKRNDKEIYVYGNYNNYAIEEQNRMTYNSQSRKYECAIKLKQGFYNYKYVVVDRNNNIDDGAISGNFWQTENSYKILVYFI